MRNNFRFLLCYSFILVFVLVGCKVKRPSDVITESQMEDLLYDYHVAKAMGDNLPYNENYKKALYIEAVFHKHGTTEAAFDSSMVWYTRNTELLSKIYERVNKRLKDQQNSINHLIALRDKKPQTSEPGDSINVWAWQQVARLTSAPLGNKFTFTLSSDSNFKKRDALLWEVRYRFLERIQDSASAAVMAMQIIYENDSTISDLRRIYQSGKQSIRLHSDSMRAIKEVKGFIYLPQAKDETRTLLLDGIMLTRYHSNDSLSTSVNDSLHADSVKSKTVEMNQKLQVTDTIKMTSVQQERLNPEEMNRRRSNVRRTVKPEQLETEKNIQMEKRQLREERRVNQQQQRRPVRHQ